MPRWWTKLVSGGIALALVVVPASVAQAQPNFADITASATVLSPLTVSWASDLDFGNVFPGVAAAVAITDAGAGGWTVAGDAGHNTVNDPSTATTFDPACVATTNLSGGAPGELRVWIGGTVTPAVNQPAGVYTNTVTLTVDYTGL